MLLINLPNSSKVSCSHEGLSIVYTWIDASIILKIICCHLELSSSYKDKEESNRQELWKFWEVHRKCHYAYSMSEHSSKVAPCKIGEWESWKAIWISQNTNEIQVIQILTRGSWLTSCCVDLAANWHVFLTKYYVFNTISRCPYLPQTIIIGTGFKYL